MTKTGNLQNIQKYNFKNMPADRQREIAKKGSDAFAEYARKKKTIRLMFEAMVEMNTQYFIEDFQKAGICVSPNDNFIDLVFKLMNKKIATDPSVKLQDLMNFVDFYAKYTGQTNPEPETRRFIDVPEAREPVIVKFVDDDDDEKQPAN